MNTPRDILDRLWYDMHDDPNLARAVRLTICKWAGCDDAIVEPDGEVWVSNSPRLLDEHETRNLVAYLCRCGIVEGAV